MQVLGVDADGDFDVSVDMGRVSFPTGPPFVRQGACVDGLVRLGLEEPSVADSMSIRALPVSVGNPHAVIFADSWTRERVSALGPLVATHPDFPQGTNVQFAEAPSGRTVTIQIWERGVGRTTSSGTSACAAAAAAVRTGGLAPGPIRVEMEGGAFDVTIGDDWSTRLRGPVRPVLEGRLTDP